jgi:hypothetical protein
MANTPGILNDTLSGIFGGGQTAAQALSANGYTPYQVTQGPNVSGNFQGYQATQANTAANQPYQTAQSALLGQLQGEATGTGGPTVADQQLQAGTGKALLAQKAATAGARGQNSGLVAAGLQTSLADTTAGAAGDAANLRASEQQNAQGALGGLTTSAISTGNKLGEFNAGSANTAANASQLASQNYGNLQNQDWQYTNNLNANQQAQYNQMIGSMTGAADQSQANVGNQIGGSLINTGIQGASQMLSMSADGGVYGMADGGMAGAPPSQFDLTGPGGGIGGGTGYDPTARMGGQARGMADGGITGFPGVAGPTTVSSDLGAMPPSLRPAIATASMQGGVPGLADGGVNISPSALPMAPYPGISVPTAPAPELTNYLPGKSGAKKPSQSPTESQSPTNGGPDADPDTSGANAGATDLAPGVGEGAPAAGGGAGEAGAAPAMAMTAADGAVSAPVAHGPEKAIIGENGPEAVIPIKPNGDVDQARARNPAVQQLLASHPGLRHVNDAGAPQGQPTGTGDHATAAALAMAGAHLSDRVANLEQLLSSQARKGARRAA